MLMRSYFGLLFMFGSLFHIPGRLPPPSQVKGFLIMETKISLLKNVSWSPDLPVFLPNVGGWEARKRAISIKQRVHWLADNYET